MDVDVFTVQEWKKRQLDIENYSIKIISYEINPSRMTAKQAANEDMEEALFMWFLTSKRYGLTYHWS